MTSRRHGFGKAGAEPEEPFALRSAAPPGNIGRRPLALLLSGAALAATLSAAPVPIVEFKMDGGSGTQVANTGSAGGSARIVGAKPTWSQNVPVNGGAAALDFGTANDTGHVVQMDQTPPALKGLKSFTITGWINCRSATTGGGGNRILSFLAPGGGQGVDLAFQSDLSLQLGVNQWNDWGTAKSNAQKITVNSQAIYNNWVFFAVTYNSLASSGHVAFYYGSNSQTVKKDISRDYARGAVGTSTGSTLSVGHVNADNRYSTADQMFRGIIDQVRIYGSTTNGSGALPLADLAQIQNAAPIAGQGVLYEEWTGITGTTIASLLESPNFPGYPSATMVRTSFEGFQYGTSKENFGARMSGWVKAPASGNYTFWLSADDNAELRVSTDANPVNKRLVASVPGFTGYEEWTKYSSQSGTVELEAGKFYYIEALLKEGVSADHLKVKWDLPSGTTESPIPQARLYLKPEDGDALFPSNVNLYEAGTSNIKATLGWHNEEGNNHLFLKSENFPKLTIFNDVINLPSKKLFFGEQTDANALGLRYDPDPVGGQPTLYVQAKSDDQWAMKFVPSQGFYQSPMTVINSTAMITGPEFNPEEDVFGFLDYSGGLTLTHNTGSAPGDFRHNSTNVGAYSIYLQEDLPGEWNTTTIYPGMAEFSITPTGQPASVTRIEGGVVTADEVRTKVWKIPPDYVFEENYRVRSLEEVERFVKKNKHLPEIPSGKQMQREGISIGDMHMRMLKTMEEMTLNMIALNKQVKAQQAKNTELEREIRSLRRAKEGAVK